MNKSERTRQAQQRFRRDVERAFKAMAGRRLARSDGVVAELLAKKIGYPEIDELIDDLRRNWRFTERARGERTLG